jgi:hypothetical protein
MKVYVLGYGERGEGSEPISVFADRDRGLQAMRELLDQESDAFVAIQHADEIDFATVNGVDHYRLQPVDGLGLYSKGETAS